MTVVAAATAALALLVLRPDPRALLRHRLGRPAPVPVTHVALGAAVLAVTVWSAAPTGAVSGPALMLGLVAAAVGTFVVRQSLAARRARRVAAARAETVHLIDLVAAELRAGALSGATLASLAADVAVLAPVTRVAALGGDVAAALRVAATEPGREALGALAGAWHVADRAGAPLAAVLERVAASARDDAEVRREIAAGAAPARASGRVMALLPLLGLALGSGMGADPVEVITTTAVGAVAVAVGAALACAGVVWVDRIASAAERG